MFNEIEGGRGTLILHCMNQHNMGFKRWNKRSDRNDWLLTGISGHQSQSRGGGHGYHTSKDSCHPQAAGPHHGTPSSQSSGNRTDTFKIT